MADQDSDDDKKKQDAKTSEENSADENKEAEKKADEPKKESPEEALERQASQRCALVMMRITDENQAMKVFEQQMKRRGDEYDMSPASGAADAIQKVSNAGRGVILFEIAKKEDIIEAVTVLTKMAELMKNNMVRVLGFSHIKQPGISEFLTRKGCSELFPMNINGRTMTYKFQRWGRLVESTFQNTLRRTRRMKKSGGGGGGMGRNNPYGRGRIQTLKWVKPLDIKSDCFIVQSKKDVRRSQGGWNAFIMGPPPNTGAWVDVVFKDRNDLHGWKWVPNDEAPEKFIEENGYWIFLGREPEFNWRTVQWRFWSRNFQLYFVQEGKDSIFKVQPTEDSVNFAVNNEHSKEVMEMIRTAVERSPDFKKAKASMSKEEQDNLFKFSSNTTEEGEEEIDEDAKDKDFEEKLEKYSAITPNKKDDDLADMGGDVSKGKGSDPVVAEGGEGLSAKELKAKQEGAGAGDEMSANEDGAGAGDALSATEEGAGAGDEMSATADGAGAGDAMSATQEGGDNSEKSATQDGAGSGEAMSATEEGGDNSQKSATQEGAGAGDAMSASEDGSAGPGGSNESGKNQKGQTGEGGVDAQGMDAKAREAMIQKGADNKSKSATQDGAGMGDAKSASEDGPGMGDAKGGKKGDTVLDSEGYQGAGNDFDMNIDWDSLVDAPNLKVLVGKTARSSGMNKSSHIEARMVDIFEKELTLELAPEGFNEGLEVGIMINFSTSELAINLGMKGKIIEVTPQEESENSLIVVDLTEFDEGKLKEFQEAYLDRQEQLVTYMKAAKGEL